MNITARLNRFALRVSLAAIPFAMAPLALAQADQSATSPEKPQAEATVNPEKKPENTTPASDNAAQEFTQILNGINTLHGAFTQTITDPNGDVIQETKGEFTVKRPGYFLWDVAPPYEQKVIGTPKELKIYDPDLEQMTVRKNDSLDGSPALLLSGDASAIAGQYTVTAKETKAAGTKQFALTNKDASDTAFDSISFRFLEKAGSYTLDDMMFVDKLGQITHVSLADVTVNKAVEDSAFDFTPPAGIDIIVDE